MKLWYSTTSPYARKAIIVLKHQNLEDRVQLLQTPMAFDANAPHNQDNPLGRIPALQMADGTWLYGSYAIAEYLDSLGEQTPLIPDGQNRWQVLTLHALADGTLENAMPVVAERLFRDKTDWWLDRQDQLLSRCQRSFADLQTSLKIFGTQLNIGTATAVCLIDWWTLRENTLELSLASNFPELVVWAQEMNRIHSELATSWKT